nr:MAG TPA: hypothetical protein [Caudoviricetes sp.]
MSTILCRIRTGTFPRAHFCKKWINNIMHTLFGSQRLEMIPRSRRGKYQSGKP